MSDSTGNDSSNRYLVPILLLVPVVAAIFFIGLFPIRDGGDQWWHLKTGKYLVGTGMQLPEEDVFSFTSKGHKWANHEWLSDTLMYLGYKSLGLKGLIILKSLILVATFLMVGWLIFRRSGKPLWSILGMLLAAWAAMYSVHLRPPVLTTFIVSVFLHMMLNLERGERVKFTQIASFFLMVLWINLHGGAILGLVIAGAYFGGSVISIVVAWMHNDPKGCMPDEKSRVWRYGINLAIVSIASLCNPFTYHIHLLTLKVMGNKELVRFVSELQMPNLHYTKGYLLLVLLLVIFALATIRRIRLADGLLTIFFLQQSLNHVRHLPLFAVVVTPILFETIAAWHSGLLSSPVARVRRLAASMHWGLVFIILLGAIGVIKDNWRGQTELFFDSPGYVRTGAPHDAADFLLHHDFTGKMYNQINYAGYLIWRLSPEHFQTFTDSRFDIFGSDVMLDCLAIESAATQAPSPVQHREYYQWLKMHSGKKPYWSYALDKYKINFMLIARDSGLHMLLNNTPDTGWVKVYEDNGYEMRSITDQTPFWLVKAYENNGYAIYIKDIPENQDLIKATLKTSEIQWPGFRARLLADR